ncbi:ATP-dependent helicase [Corynebacterium sp. 35RC1]|nr:ATP-dependent helicase [Corynebacterium sp. 35RC1]
MTAQPSPNASASEPAAGSASAPAVSGGSPQSVPEAAFLVPPNPKIVPIAHGQSDPEQPAVEWDNPLFAQRSGHWRVRGAAGTGVSTLLMDLAAQQIADGHPASSILVIATSSGAAKRLRTGIAQRATQYGYSAEGPMVRTVHSLAFALLRTLEEEQFRLITGAEQDAVIRDLLQGAAEGVSKVQWPEEVQGALPLVGFARGLRDFLLRAAERGLSPEDLEQLGEQHNRPLWRAAGEFLREYEQTLEIGGNHNLSASELLSRLATHTISDQGWRTILVDDAQHLDPAALELIDQLRKFATFTVIGGNPDQSVFHFRGAAEDAMEKLPVEHDLKLSAPLREAPVHAVIAENATVHANYVADILRRAHLLDNIAWSQLAVVVRDVKDIAPMRRILLGAGVPVHINPTDVVLGQQPIVRSLMLAAKATVEPLENSEVEELALGPIGGADPVRLRRLLRALRQVEMRRGSNRRALTVLAELVQPMHAEAAQEILAEVQTVLTESELGILTRIREVLHAGTQPGTVEEVLWNLWDASKLSGHLSAVSLRGGARGSQADRDLDAIMALFDAAGDWVERRPGTTVHTFLRNIEEQELPTGVRDRRSVVPEAVEVLTAHGCVGREWDTVVVAGVQENSWPSLKETGSLFGQQQLVDLIDNGIDPDQIISRTAERLRDEEALFALATTRARRVTYVTAVNNLEGEEISEPSRFLTPLRPKTLSAEARLHLPSADSGEAADAADADQANGAVRAVGAVAGNPEWESVGDSVGDEHYVRLLSQPTVVAELRRALADETTDAATKAQAARQLARLAQAGIASAHPHYWWGAKAQSVDEPLDVRRLSPSKVEAALSCPMYATFSGVLLDESKPLAMVRGTLAHAYAEALAKGVDPQLAREKVTEAMERLLDGPRWFNEGQLTKWKIMLDNIFNWHHAQLGQAELVGVEVPVRVDVNGVTIGGSIDRLQHRAEGFQIFDLKTGNSPMSQADADEHLQLATYQLALRHGKITTKQASGVEEQEMGQPASSVRIETTDAEGLEVCNAVLQYPALENNPSREQSAKTEEELAELANVLPQLLQDLRGPKFTARQNKFCAHCELVEICPAQDEGRSVLG